MTYYIPFYIEQKINYTFLFSLYKIATKSKDKIKNVIQYNSVDNLRTAIQTATNYTISNSTINKYLTDTKYNNFFICDKKNKTITILNNFKKTNKERVNRFITMTDTEINYFIEKDDNLLTRYYIYIKYYCWYTKDKQTDFTAKQFLVAIGYSVKSGDTLSLLSTYNTLLTNDKYITIKRYKDIHGNNRNIYRMNI